jgi:Gram-negative bacterial TonB protein C-terminal
MKYVLQVAFYFFFISASGQNETFQFESIENPPLYSSCVGGSLKEKKVCTQLAIETFAKEKFNTGLFKNLNLNEKRIRVYAQFTIDVTGKATKIKVRTAHPQLEKETKRVLHLLPRLLPGKKDEKPVATQYNLPLIFILG